jgi:predicted RNase H-like HicB family nuclease
LTAVPRSTIGRPARPVKCDRSAGDRALEQALCYTGAKGGSKLVIALQRDEDGRWIAEVPALSGVLVYGESGEQAVARVEARAPRVLADRLEYGEAVPELSGLFQAAWAGGSVAALACSRIATAAGRQCSRVP